MLNFSYVTGVIFLFASVLRVVFMSLLTSFSKVTHLYSYVNKIPSYNNVNNQQDATTFSFINLFNSALYVSGDKFAHPQEHFLTVYTAFGTMHRHCCLPVGSSVGALYQTLYIQAKIAPEDGRICRPKHVGLN